MKTRDLKVWAVKRLAIFLTMRNLCPRLRVRLIEWLHDNR